MHLRSCLPLAICVSVVVCVPSPQQSSVTSVVAPASPSVSTISSIPPLSPNTTIPNEPCATLSAYLARTPASSLVPADVAWSCLQSVPVNITQSIPWIQSLKPYIKWQSTLSYAKNPPKSWPFAPDDVLGRMEGIITNITSYANEYALEFAVWQAIHQVYDGHFSYIPIMIGGIVSFGRPLSLVSISQNGKDLPKPYVASDILLAANNTSFLPSAIRLINGQNVTMYLQALGAYGPENSLDAQYNRVFSTLAQLSRGTLDIGGGTFAGGGYGGYFYPGANTTLIFENGTDRTYQNFARVISIDLATVTTGQELYDKFINTDRYSTTSPVASATATPALTTSPVNNTTSQIGTTATSPASSLTTRPTSTSTSMAPPPAGYPTPVVSTDGYPLAGYYLQGSGYEDVAVLAVSSFDPLAVTGLAAYQAASYNFLYQAVVAGKKRLVIDLSSNGGGQLAESYNLFANLMPDIVPYGGSRFRDHDAFRIISKTYSSLYVNSTSINALQQLYTYQFWLNQNLTNFTSFHDFYGPQHLHGDKFTRTLRWKTKNLNAGVIFGSGNGTSAFRTRPFDVQNIILLTDGFCASACSVFAEFLILQAGVKTVTLGGLPRAGPMDLIGGTKGAQSTPWGVLRIVAADLLTDPRLNASQQSQLSNGVLGEYNNFLPFYQAVGHDASLNLRSAYLPNGTQTPLQYISQPADCRIYYRQAFNIDITTLWKTVVDVTWGNGTCAYGSVKPSSSRRDSIPLADSDTRHPVRREAMRPAELARLHAAQFIETDPLLHLRSSKYAGGW